MLGLSQQPGCGLGSRAGADIEASLHLHDSSVDKRTDVVGAAIILLVCRHAGPGDIRVAGSHDVIIGLLDLFLGRSG